MLICSHKILICGHEIPRNLRKQPTGFPEGKCLFLLCSCQDLIDISHILDSYSITLVLEVEGFS